MKRAAYVAGLLGLTLFVALMIRANSQDILRISALAGWRLLWLLPYRALYFLLFAAGWHWLFVAANPMRSVSYSQLFWLTGLREAVDRLLPVASIGGAFVAVRLLSRRGVGRVKASATIILEVLLTLWTSYLFAALGFLLWAWHTHSDSSGHHFWAALLLTLPVPLLLMFLLRHGRVFGRLQRHVNPWMGLQGTSDGARALDQTVQRLIRRPDTWVVAGGLQFAALLSGSIEIWLALGWFGHPVELTTSVVLESATQAVRHLAFLVPAALGAQEAGLVAFGQLLGISPEMALAVSIAKRMRELLCGLPFLAAWQWLEARHLRAAPESGLHG